MDGICAKTRWEYGHDRHRDLSLQNKARFLRILKRDSETEETFRYLAGGALCRDKKQERGRKRSRPGVR